MNLFCKVFPWLCSDTDIVANEYDFSQSFSVNELDQRRALSEFKSARTLIKKALMRVNSKRLGKVLYELDHVIVELGLKLKK